MTSDLQIDVNCQRIKFSNNKENYAKLTSAAVHAGETTERSHHLL